MSPSNRPGARACVRPVLPTLLALAVVALVIAATAGVAAAAATGRVSGKVLARDTGEPLPYCDVLLIPTDVAGRRAGAMSNADGTFLLQAAPGAYTLQVRAISYRTRQVTGVVLTAGGTEVLSVELEPEAIEQEEIVVEARAVTNTEGALLSQRRKAAAAGDAVSAEQVRKSADRDAADVLKRVTGASVVDNKYVYVRGLGERYSSTSIDGVRVGSPEPNKRVVPLDLLPANLLDNVVVQKTYTADRPGEFGGGDVQVQTKAFPGQRIYGFSLTQGFTPGTTFNDDFQSYGGTSGDFFGYGTGSRSMPSLVEDWAGSRRAIPGTFLSPGFRGDSLAAMGQSFGNVWSPSAITPAFNGAAQLNFGDELRVAGRSLGVLGSLSWSRTRNTQEEVQRFYQTDLSTNADYAVKRWSETVLLGGTAGLAYRLHPAHALGVRGTYSNSAEDEVRRYTGYFNSQNSDYYNTRLMYVQRELASGSVNGEHDLRALREARVEWRASYNQASRDEPDRREVTYQGVRDADGNVNPTPALGGAGRTFSTLREYGRGFDVKVGAPLGRGRWAGSKVEVGGSWQDKDRTSVVRRFGFSTDNPAFQGASAESAFQDSEWKPESQPGAVFRDGTFPEDAYEADQTVTAGFVSADVAVLRRLRAIAGLRVEDGSQDVRTYNQFTGQTVVSSVGGVDKPAFARLSDTDLLPTLNLVYTLDDRTNVRAAAARTLSRPDVRELNPGPTLDYIGGFRFIGNPELQRSTLWNYDLRAEMFPSVGEVLAVSVFYKDFDQPIEYAILPSDQPIISPVNSESGHNVGVELEGRLNLTRLSKSLNGFSLNLNASIIESKVTLGGQGLGSNEHPLQGQSDHLVNAGLQYVSRDAKWDASALVNRTGRRLLNLGYSPTPDIYELPTTTLDMAVNLRPWPRWRIKVSGSNLLDTEYRSEQGGLLYRSYSPGTSFAVSASYGS